MPARVTLVFTLAFLALAELTSTPQSPVLFLKVFASGDDMHGVYVRMTRGLFDSDSNFAVLMNHALEGQQQLASPDRVMTERGNVVEVFEDLLDVERIYVLGTGMHFHWPGVRIGHRIDLGIDVDGDMVELETLSLEPKVFKIHHFVSFDEADALIEQNRNELARSATGMEFRTKKTEPNKLRTSLNAFDVTSDLAMKIKRRSFDMLRMEYVDTQADGLQVLKYNVGQAYVPHVDQFEIGMDKTGKHNFDSKNGGANRMATVFLYLNDAVEGGETVFPLSTSPLRFHNGSQELTDPLKYFEEDSWEHDMVKKCRTKLAVPARKGSAILFYTQFGTGDLDPQSLHGGCPVMQGEKWAANMWVWNGPRYGYDADLNIAATFRNPSSVAVTVFWKDLDDDNVVEMFKLNSMEENSIDTHVGHVFVFRGDDGVEKEFTMTEGKLMYIYQTTGVAPGTANQPEAALHSEL